MTGEPPSPVPTHMLAELVERVTGLALARGGVSGSLDRFVNERLTKLGLRIDDYVALVSDPASPELRKLIDAITVQHTWFYRDAEQLQTIAKLLAAMPPGPLAIWVAGCATGEEAYTLAMICRRIGREVTVLATDVNETALETARRGRYSALAVRDVPEAEKRWLPVHGSHFEVDQGLRDSVTFKRHNLVEVPPQGPRGGWDLVVCRNVLIYFSRAAAARLLERFARAIKEGGSLVVGASEVLFEPPPGLELMTSHNRLVLRRPVRPGMSAPSIYTPPAPSVPATPSVPAAPLARPLLPPTTPPALQLRTPINDPRSNTERRMAEARQSLERQTAERQAQEAKLVAKPRTITEQPPIVEPPRTITPNRPVAEPPRAFARASTESSREFPRPGTESSREFPRAGTESSREPAKPVAKPVTGAVGATGAAAASVRDDELIATLNRGHALFEHGDIVAAIRVYSDLANRAQDIPEPWLFLGIAHYSHGEMELAAKELRAALCLNTKLWPAIFYLARCYESLGRRSEALQQYDLAALDDLQPVALRSESAMINELRALRSDFRNAARRVSSDRGISLRRLIRDDVD
jgi:chemotaxis protein methyltransferase CheR